MGPISPRKAVVRELFESNAQARDSWIDRNIFYYREHWRYMRFLVPEGLRVLDLACGTGRLLGALKPSRGVGIDMSAQMIDKAHQNHPEFEYVVGDIEDPATIAAVEGPFDVIVLADAIGYLDDCEETLRRIHPLCTPETRIIVSYYNRLWEPILVAAEKLHAKMVSGATNWLSTSDITNILDLADFETIKREWRQLMPKRILGLGTLINRFLGPLPLIRRLCLRNYIVARPKPAPRAPEDRPSVSVSVIVPCRNERGNIENAVRRMPPLGGDVEIVFVEGNSHDGTWEEVQRVRDAYPDRDIKCLQQEGRGKGDAVRKGFDNARGDLLMILDADLTVRPEDLGKFYRAYVGGKGEFINGTRLVYPMESGAMQLLNYFANWAFAETFSYLLNQQFTDTLCGTKVLARAAYRRIADNRAYFGEFDPFGDFDLIFGATRLNLKFVEVPIRYMSREYGETQILRFSHGWLLLRMVVFAYRKLKAF